MLSLDIKLKVNHRKRFASEKILKAIKSVIKLNGPSARNLNSMLGCGSTATATF